MRPAFFALPAVLLASLGLVTACSSGREDARQPLQGTAIGISVEAIDTRVDPGDDFYNYANGSWIASTEIPADKTSVGAWSFAYDRTQQRLQTMVEELAGQPQDDGTPEALIARYYRAFTDTTAIDGAGMEPVQRDLDRFAKIESVTDLSRVIGEQLRADVDPFNYTDFDTANLFGLFVSKPLTGDAMTPYLLQGGLGMPDRIYYVSDTPEMQANRTAYRAYIARVFRLSGFDRPNARAQAVLDLETKIAQAHMTRIESYDLAARGSQWEGADFARRAPGMDWDAFFRASGLQDAGTFSVFHERAIPALSNLVASEPLDAWKDWLAFHQIDEHADVMPRPIRVAHFEFADKRLAGREQQRPRSELAIRAMRPILGDALGAVYVARHFPEEQRRDVEIMVERIREAFEVRLQASDWMAPETRDAAVEKVRTMVVGIGQPKAPDDYTGLTFRGRSAYGMTIAAEKAATRRQLAKIGKPVDRDEWWLSAHEINALNLPVQNAMNFPAAFMQPPQYDPEADAAFNYGALGATIGHEIVHGFDDVGAEFDQNGEMRNWWTPADKAEFKRRGQKLADQFSAYRPFPDLQINGNLTLSENIADLVGLQAAYDAYRASLGGKEPPVIEGFTGDQRFFIAFAQSWADKTRDKVLRDQIQSDGHAPDRYRAQTVRNIDAWYRAFDVEKGEALYLSPEERVTIF
ncbi:M13 family metallopeptidase [Croceicoccus naphthovorans]|uniref:M13 family metallopeptidase n=1 Tax=Croceicoccus naphthovorans TaxID=1348774 RepID=UPI0018420097|nr:M13 family metallopeptidase [Croceicoccus naphthovorans]MBB3990656.1 putative metalloendopeptidase [Croceicoccus naphthovorans]